MARGKVYSFRRKTISIPCILSILIYLFPESSLCFWKIYSELMIKVMIIVHQDKLRYHLSFFFDSTDDNMHIYLSTSMTSSVYSFWCLLEMTPLVFFPFGVSFRWFIRWLLNFTLLVLPLDPSIYSVGVSLPLFLLVSPLDSLFYSVGVSLPLILLLSPLYPYFIPLVSPCLYYFWCHL